MEYLGTRGGLLAYMLPLNFLIGEYTIYLKLHNKRRLHIHLVILVISVLVSYLSYMTNKELYYSFTICGSVLIGIIQNELKFRKRVWDSDDHELEFLVDEMKMILGILPFLMVLIRPIYTSIFEVLPGVVRGYSEIVMILLGIELITFNYILQKKRAKIIDGECSEVNRGKEQ